MENKETYIAKNEIRVKKLLSEMYNNESNLLSKLEKEKEQLRELNHKIEQLEEDYQNQKSLRNDLTEKFNALKEQSVSSWEDFKSEYEMVLDLAEGDKNNFIQKAEAFINDLNVKIDELNEKVKDSAEATRKKSEQMRDELNERKEALQQRLAEAKEDTGEVWVEVKQWFIERAKNLRTLF